jgi:hypothetical protein
MLLVLPEPKPGYAELLIAVTSSHTCTKPNVVRRVEKLSTQLKLIFVINFEA